MWSFTKTYSAYSVSSLICSKCAGHFPATALDNEQGLYLFFSCSPFSTCWISSVLNWISIRSMPSWRKEMGNRANDIWSGFRVCACFLKVFCALAHVALFSFALTGNVCRKQVLHMRTNCWLVLQLYIEFRVFSLKGLTMDRTSCGQLFWAIV